MQYVNAWYWQTHDSWPVARGGESDRSDDPLPSPEIQPGPTWKVRWAPVISSSYP